MKRCVKYSGTALGVMLAMSLSSFNAHADPVIDLNKCYLLPNTGNYVTDGQIDCYTGQHVSVAGNAGNNVGTSPADRSGKDWRGTRDERRHKAAGNAFRKNTRKAVQSALAAKKALKDRDWPAVRQHTRDAVRYGKIAKGKLQLWQRTKP